MSTEELLTKIVENTSPKESISIVASASETEINTMFNPPVQLNPKRHYEMALVNLETYYSFPNVDETKNTFVYSPDGGKSWDSVELSTGSYELDQINDQIQSKVGRHVTIGANTATLRCTLQISDNYVVDFRRPNSLRSLLGFNAEVYRQGYHESENIVNILSINSILVNVSIIGSSYVDGSPEPTIYSFFPNASPGEKILERPKNLVYLPVTMRTISKMRTELKDQQNRKLDLRGEKLTIRFHLREQ